MSLEQKSSNLRSIESLVSDDLSENKKSRLAFRRVSELPDTFFDSLLPLHLLNNDLDQPVLLPDLMKTIAQKDSWMEASRKLKLSDSTVRQMGKGWINHFIQSGDLDGVRELNIDSRWQRKMEEWRREYQNYQVMVAFVTSDSFRDNIELINGLRVSVLRKSANKERKGLWELLVDYYGWGVDKQSAKMLEKTIGLDDRRTKCVARGSLEFLNIIFEVGFDVETSKESSRFTNDLLVQFDRLSMAYDHLHKPNARLLPVEKLTLELIVKGLTQQEIRQELVQMQLDLPDQLVVTTGSLEDYSSKIFGMKVGIQPFSRVRMAKNAARILKRDGGSLDKRTRYVLEQVKLGTPFSQIEDEKLGIKPIDAQRIANSFDIKMPGSIKNREVLGRIRVQLNEDVRELNSDWPGMKDDLKILELLATDEVLTYEEVARELGVAEDRISLAVARSRAMIRSKGVYPARGRKLG